MTYKDARRMIATQIYCSMDVNRAGIETKAQLMKAAVGEADQMLETLRTVKPGYWVAVDPTKNPGALTEWVDINQNEEI